ncbi:hypothetical protein IKQ21_06760, partial [bacterium]|nr:hypothetical protein [bacterium]
MVDGTNINLKNSLPFGENKIPHKESGANIDAHYSDSMKVERPKINPENIKITVPHKTLYSDADATKRIQQLNTDIYEGQKKEKAKNEFNFKTYFKLIAAFILAAAS